MNTRTALVVPTVCLFLLASAGALGGNKFEIISSGVSGSFHLKREHLQLILMVFGGAMLLTSILCIVVPRRNPMIANYSGWQTSAAVSFLFSVGLFTASAFI